MLLFSSATGTQYSVSAVFVCLATHYSSQSMLSGLCCCCGEGEYAWLWVLVKPMWWQKIKKLIRAVMSLQLVAEFSCFSRTDPAVCVQSRRYLRLCKTTEVTCY
jgi:hypothetical protein